MALSEAPGRSTSSQRPWPSLVATLPIVLLIAVGAAPARSASQEAGPAGARTDAERAPRDALGLWLHRDAAGHLRIVLERATGVYVREWRPAETLDERTQREVRQALDTNAPPSRAVLIRVHPKVEFAALKGLMLACGAKEPSGYRTYVEVVAEFPARVLGPRR